MMMNERLKNNTGSISLVLYVTGINIRARKLVWICNLFRVKYGCNLQRCRPVYVYIYIKGFKLRRFLGEKMSAGAHGDKSYVCITPLYLFATLVLLVRKSVENFLLHRLTAEYRYHIMESIKCTHHYNTNGNYSNDLMIIR